MPADPSLQAARNRDAAQRYRDRSKAYLAILEARIAELENNTRPMGGQGPLVAPTPGSLPIPSTTAATALIPLVPNGINQVNDLGPSPVRRVAIDLAPIAPAPRDLVSENAMAILQADNAVLRAHATALSDHNRALYAQNASLIRLIESDSFGRSQDNAHHRSTGATPNNHHDHFLPSFSTQPGISQNAHAAPILEKCPSIDRKPHEVGNLAARRNLEWAARVVVVLARRQGWAEDPTLTAISPARRWISRAHMLKAQSMLRYRRK